MDSSDSDTRRAELDEMHLLLATIRARAADMRILSAETQRQLTAARALLRPVQPSDDETRSSSKPSPTPWDEGH